jgi:two-component system response regulator PilR (NtrC family)
VYKVLIVDDERSMREFLAIVLKKEGYAVSVAAHGAEALSALDKEIFDLVLSDVKMPGLSGIDVLKAVKAASPSTIVLMMTAFASTDSAVEAMREGAYDYLTKPFKIDEVKLLVKNALEKKELLAENARLKQEVHERSAFDQIIGRSEKLTKVLDLIRKVADTSSNVLIFGESGTGKELVARAIHYNSRRRDRPFVTVNCSALPEPLLESELFGHMKGAFTGAVCNNAVGYPSQAAAGAPGERVPAGRRHPRHEDRRPHRGCHESGSGESDRRRAIPRRPLLPPGRDPHPSSAVARAAGGYPAVG